MFADWMGLNLLTQGSDSSQSGPLQTAMESFGSGAEEGLTSLKNAVQSYNDSQAQAVLAAFDAEFCTDASYEASSQKPLNFTGERQVFLNFMALFLASHTCNLQDSPKSAAITPRPMFCFGHDICAADVTSHSLHQSLLHPCLRT